MCEGVCLLWQFPLCSALTFNHDQALWMDGLVRIGEAVSAQERSELLDVMQDKEVHVRTDTYETLLAAVAEQQLL